MMRIRSNQMTAVWQRGDLLDWLARAFPEYFHRWSPEERGAYVDSRGARAIALGFTRPDHLRFLIGYELGCGVALADGDAAAEPSAARRLLLQRDLDPEKRIEAVERLLYGEPDDGP